MIKLLSGIGQRLTASSRRNTFLPILLTLRDAQNRPNKCNLYGLAFIAYSSFLGIVKNCLRYKSGPYLTQSVKDRLVFHDTILDRSYVNVSSHIPFCLIAGKTNKDYVFHFLTTISNYLFYRGKCRKENRNSPLICGK